LDTLLAGLKAAGEPTRLRLLALLARAELTVSEVTRILGQSQPRVSRHLRLLCEAGLLDRFQEGAWVFYGIAESGPGAELARALNGLLPRKDPALERDLERLAEVQRERAATASAYFAKVAEDWTRIRALHVAESEVEQAMTECAGEQRLQDLLDLGTGTGRVLELFGERVSHGLGIDQSPEMLAVARANLERRGLRHCQVRRGDIYQLQLPAGCMDLVTIHHVLHFLDDPARAVTEAARTLRAGGRLLVVDFAPHALEHLRTDLAHRRLGFDDAEVADWCEAAGLVDVSVRHLAPADGSADLTVSLWTAAQHEHAPSHFRLEVA
jgi:ArsR family transcriptional regulator